MKKIAILGSSGSIGRQTLNVVRRFPDKFKIVALSVNTATDELRRQADEFRPSAVGICDLSAYKNAKENFQDLYCYGGDDALSEIAQRDDIDILVVAVVGMCGLRAVMTALDRGVSVALANKESLVAGGELVMQAAKKANKEILPIDSEHSAVWQCLKSGVKSEVKRIVLTASGGPFYGKDRNFLKKVTPQMALKHPTWNMGAKISVDSATMMNKALEIIEAKWLFDTDNIDYIIHKQSIIHSMVEFVDGSTIAQMSCPDMELPIQIALSYPERLPFDRCSFKFDRTLTFDAPDESVFPLPALARDVLKAGGNAPCLFNAANEAAVELFLNNKIGFTDISLIVEKALANIEYISKPTISDIYETFDATYGKLMRDYNR